MSLAKQAISVDLTQGLDTKTSAKLVIPGKLTRLENGVFRGASIGKRYGFSALARADDAGNTLTNCVGLAAFRDSLLRAQSLAGGTHQLFSLATAVSQWTETQQVPPFATLKRTPLVRNDRTQANVDFATGGGVSVLAWVEPDGPSPGIHVMVYDEATGAEYQRDTVLSTLSGAIVAPGYDTGVYPRAFIFSSVAHVYWIDRDGKLYLRILDLSVPANNWASKLTLKTDATANWFDAVLFGATVALEYQVTDESHYRLMLLNSAGAVSTSPAAVVVDTTAEGGDQSTSGIGTDGTNLYVVVGNIGKVRVFSAALAQSANFALTITGSGPSLCQRAGLGSGVLIVLGEQNGAQYDGVLKYAIISTNALQSSGVLGRGLTLMSRPIQSAAAGAPVMMGVLYFPPPNFSATTVQPSAWVITEAGTVVARVLPGGAVALNGLASQRIPATVEVSSGVLAFALPEQNHTYVAQAYSRGLGGPTVVSTRGTSKFALTLERWAALPRARIGDLLFVGGARPSYWDGSVYAEAGFNVFPENLSAGSAVAAAGTGLSAGQYQWVAVYRWVDAQGQLHRSCPSPPLTASPGAGKRQTVNVPTLRLTDKETVDLSKVSLELYRTEGNGTVFYGTTQYSPVSLANNSAVDSIAIADEYPDASLINNELLYTTGGVLEAVAPPACRYALAHRNRLFLAGLEDPYEVRYSTRQVTREAVRFNEVLSFRVPTARGEVRGLATLDDKLIIFAERGLYAIAGDGPDATGLNNTFSEPEVITSDVGCSDGKSIVATTDGLWFLSPKGWTLLTRALSVEYAGAEAEAYAGYSVRSAEVVESQSQVRWQLDTGNDLTGIVLVYDYLRRQWGIFTGCGGLDAVQWRGLYTRARSDGQVYQEAVGTYSDAGASYSLLLETGWLKPTTIQGFARVYEAYLLGQYNSDASLLWEVAYDYATAYTDSQTYAGNGVYTVGGPYQVRRQLATQQCEAVRFRLTESGLGGTFQGLSLDNLTLSVGVKRGLYKLPATKTVG